MLKITLGSKNNLFAGSHEAAKSYTLMDTYKMHGIHPFIYLKDVLKRIGSYPINQIEMLLPKIGRQKLSMWCRSGDTYQLLENEVQRTSIVILTLAIGMSLKNVVI